MSDWAGFARGVKLPPPKHCKRKEKDRKARLPDVGVTRC